MPIIESNNSCDNSNLSVPTKKSSEQEFIKKPVDTSFFEHVIERFDQVSTSEDLPPALLGQ